MEGELVVGLVAVVGLILVPSLAIAVRVSLKPMVEAVVLLREALGKSTPAMRASEDAEATRARLAYLEAAVSELQEASAFFRDLRTPEPSAPALSDGSRTAETTAQRQGDPQSSRGRTRAGSPLRAEAAELTRPGG
jgi:hypothetical protein